MATADTLVQPLKFKRMANSVASALNAIARDSGFGDSEALSGFIADYFADTTSDNEFDSGETQPQILTTIINNQLC